MLFDDYLKEGETAEDLQLSGLFIFQKNGGFRFGTDAVILADFAAPERGEAVVDLGCGTGIIPVLMAANSPAASIKGVEILPEYADMARRCVAANGLSDRIEIIEGDYRLCPSTPACASLVSANPPYVRVQSGLQPADRARAAARFELHASLEDTVRAAARLLQPQGRFCMVHRPERLAECIYIMSSLGLPPKRLRMVESRAGEAPVLFLIEGRRGAKEGLRVLPPLRLLSESGAESEELRKIYRREELK